MFQGALHRVGYLETTARVSRTHRRGALAIRKVRVGTVCEKRFHGFEVTFLDRQDQRSAPFRVWHVHIDISRKRGL